MSILAFTVTNPGFYISGIPTSQEAAVLTNLTGLTYANGDILYHNGTNLTNLAAGTNGHILTLSGGVPTWAANAGSGYTNLTQFIGQTPWRLFYSDSLGDVTELALGADGTFLKSNGAAVAPSFATPTGSGDVVGPASASDNAVARFDTTTGKLIQNSTVLLGDDGTFGNVNSIILDTTYTGTPVEGEIYWDNVEKTLSVDTGIGGVTMQVGREHHIYANNNTGSTIADGMAVYITGATGTTPTIAYAQANDYTKSSKTIGVTTMSILTTASGLVTTYGYVHDLNTSGFTAGDVLYLSNSVSGGITNVNPTGINYTIRLGYCITSHVSAGIIFVDPKMIVAFESDEFKVVDSTDKTKQGAFNVAGVTSGVKRVYTLPNLDTTLIGETTTNVLTNKSISLGTNTLTTTKAQLNTAVTDGELAFTVGTPVDNQVAVWTGDGTIEGTAGLTFSANVLGVGTAANGVVQSNGSFDLILQTGNATTGSITIADGAAGQITIAPATTGVVQLLSAEDGATGVILEMYKNSASPAANDIVSKIIFYGKDSAGNKEEYGDIACQIDDPTSTSEDSNLTFRVITAGVSAQKLKLNGAELLPTVNNGLNLGTTANQFQTAYVGTVELNHATDTTISRVSAGVIAVEGVTVPTISSTNTFTNKRVTKRVTTETSSATPTINTDNCDIHTVTALAVAITSMTTNLSGTPTDGQTLMIQITGTAARAITWGASFEASTVALPTTTVTTARLDVGFIWNTATSKWRCIASA